MGKSASAEKSFLKPPPKNNVKGPIEMGPLLIEKIPYFR
jgi:hypothetical protein